MREFKDGYIAGWRWIRGNNDLPSVPSCSIPAGETAYREGIIRGVHDACESPDATASSQDIDNILDRALDKRPRS
jgi:hypothetical protein